MRDIKALLNADMSTLLHELQRLWVWWTGELGAMLPASLRDSSGARTRLVAEFVGGNLIFREYRRGSAVAVPRRGEPETLLMKAVFALPAAAILIREVSYPMLPMADLRRMTALDMDRMTPFRSEDVAFDLEIQSGPGGSARRVMIGIVRRKVIEETLDHLWSFGAEPLALSLVDRHDGTSRFDFLKAAQLRGRRPLLGLRPGTWWMIAVALFAANIALLVAKDVYSVTSLQSAVEAQRGSVVLASSLRRRVELESRRRSVVLESLKHATPLAILEGVTETLPDGVSVRRLEWNGKVLHLVGATPPDQDISALLDASPLLHPGRTPLGKTGTMPMAPSATKPAAQPVGAMNGAGVPSPAAIGIFDVTVDLKDRR